jgi:hypothetical protein
VAAKVGNAPAPATRRRRRSPPPPPPPKPWWRRWWDRPRARRRVLILGFLGSIALLAAVTVRLLVLPRAVVPGRADAVVLLADDEAEATRALELMNRQVAPVLVVAGGDDPAHTLAYRLCTQPPPFEVQCRPGLDAATRSAGSAGAAAPAVPAAGGVPPAGEGPPARNAPPDVADARAVGQLAATRGWGRLAVVSLPEQLSRGRLLLQRCSAAEVLPVAVETPVGQRAQHLVPATAAYLRALFLDRAC